MVSLPRCGSLWAFGPSAHRAHASLRALPGFGADSRSLNRRGGRWPRPPLVSLPTFGRFALRATAHRADASLRCPKPCAAAQKSERCECPKGTRNAPRSTPPRISAQTARPSSTRRGRAASIQKTLSFGKTRVSRSPSVARNARRALPPEALASSCVFLHQAAFLASLRSLATLDGLCRRKRRRPPLLPASSRVSCSLRSLATLTAFAAAEVFGALPQTPARA